MSSRWIGVKPVLALFITFVSILALQPIFVRASSVLMDFDTLPGGSWQHYSSGGSAVVSNGILMIDAPSDFNEFVLSYPHDQWHRYVNSSRGWVIEARLRVDPISQPGCGFLKIQANDHYKFVGLGFGLDGICLGPLQFPMNTTNDFHVYRIESKLAAVQVYVDGILAINYTFSSVSAGCLECSSDLLMFGDGNFGTKSRSYWDYFWYDVFSSHPTQPPLAAFSFKPTDQVLVDHSVAFDAEWSNDSTGTISDYLWNFGDGTTSSGIAPSHSYASEGTFTVSLTVTDNNGRFGSTTANITVIHDAHPSIALTVIPRILSTLRDSAGAAAFLSHEYEFCDIGNTVLDIQANDTAGIPVNLQGATLVPGECQKDYSNIHGTNQPEVHSVTALAKDSLGDDVVSRANASVDFAIAQAGQVSIDRTPVTGVSLAVSSPDLPEDAPVTLTSSSFDGQPTGTRNVILDSARFFNIQVNTLYSCADQYHCFPTILRGNVGICTATSFIGSGNLLQYWAPDIDKWVIASNLTFTSDRLCGDIPASALWTDAIFQLTGVLIVAGSHTLPLANFNVSTTPVQVGRPVTFDGSISSDTTSTIISYSWNFGDGTSSSGITVSHTYLALGTFKVALTVTDSLGLPGHSTRKITTVLPPGQHAKLDKWKADAVAPTHLQLGRYETLRAYGTNDGNVTVYVYAKFEISPSLSVYTRIVELIPGQSIDGKRNPLLSVTFIPMTIGTYTVTATIFYGPANPPIGTNSYTEDPNSMKTLTFSVG